MPFEKFFLCSRIVYILGCSHTSTTKIRKLFRIKDTAWESALNDIALCALPSLVPIPFGIQIESCYYNEACIDEMKKISPEHGFWAKIFTDVIEQTETDSDIVSIVQQLMTSKTASTLRRDPCHSATKNFRNMTAASGPFIDFPSWERISILQALQRLKK